ncbi:hypothetical protein TNCV_1027591 [Trichonephila clavipes]|nr:hypothetical protein TNCV_1027591 [Trichonephila clavipes]
MGQMRDAEQRLSPLIAVGPKLPTYRVVWRGHRGEKEEESEQDRKSQQHGGGRSKMATGWMDGDFANLDESNAKNQFAFKYAACLYYTSFMSDRVRCFSTCFSSGHDGSSVRWGGPTSPDCPAHKTTAAYGPCGQKANPGSSGVWDVAYDDTRETRSQVFNNQ